MKEHNVSSLANGAAKHFACFPLACIASVSEFSRAQNTENPRVPRSFFAPQTHGSARYVSQLPANF